jgi:hypothetical protein
MNKKLLLLFFSITLLSSTHTAVGEEQDEIARALQEQIQAEIDAQIQAQHQEALQKERLQKQITNELTQLVNTWDQSYPLSLKQALNGNPFRDIMPILIHMINQLSIENNQEICIDDYLHPCYEQLKNIYLKKEKNKKRIKNRRIKNCIKVEIKRLINSWDKTYSLCLDEALNMDHSNNLNPIPSKLHKILSDLDLNETKWTPYTRSLLKRVHGRIIDQTEMEQRLYKNAACYLKHEMR